MKMENIALEKDRKRVRQIWLGMEREKFLGLLFMWKRDIERDRENDREKNKEIERERKRER